MIMRFFPLAFAFLFISCTDFKFDNPDDPNSSDYVKERSSSSVMVSSSSSIPTQSGIVYGPSVSYEGETYQTVVIGTQTWMARNLNYASSGSKCYNNQESNCATYGRLYDWSTAMSVCPSGWHLPTNADWDKLVRYADGTSGTSSPYDSPTAGRYLKSGSGWSSGGNGEDKYGFSALPGGFGLSDGSFYGVGDVGHWWSATEFNASSAYVQEMYSSGDDVYMRNYGKSHGYSVRCLRD